MIPERSQSSQARSGALAFGGPTTDPTHGNPAAEPLLSVTKGNPTAEELAAVTAVVLALAAGGETASTAAPTRHWARRSQLNLPPSPGAGSWRRSAR
ncbi:acyl-CoA carboxylase subunit epsilon [Arthrobacter sp. LAPM80]|uniref:acyl-CoA carboxylase subunit epsilon n=1 Tax=Arthrobacter sp. LAPM80 TaxID=3141788 RepID=UPI00398B8DD7